MANIEINKLSEIIGAIGKDTIVAIAKVNSFSKIILLKGGTRNESQTIERIRIKRLFSNGWKKSN